ncbi:MAG: sigma-54-dependent Fis family transcriptional regulator, partial [Calditrichaeota bacterium]
MNHHSLLVVDDEQSQRDALVGFLRKKGYTVLPAENGTQAIGLIQKETVDLILTDLRMPSMDGMRLLQETKKLNPEIIVIMMTAYGEIDTAIQSIKEGAADFINKPVNLGQLEVIIAKALERKQLLSENLRLKELVKERLQFGGIMTESSSMQQALSIAARAAMSKATVLIIGESGTGKELVARAIHTASPRSDQPFVAVNMAALSDNLVESELFGYEKGAFTGASMTRKGRFEIADKGTLFIDEVGEIPPSTQVKLLRVLQEQSVERIGANNLVHFDVRLVAATHRNLEEMVKAGEFREDFYYRLNVIRIHLPPLRERKGDIPLLV